MEEYIPLFEQYLDDELSAEERKAFELRLLEEEEFAKEFKEYKTIVEGLQIMDQGDLTSSIKDVRSSLVKEGFFFNEEDIDDYLTDNLASDKRILLEQKINNDESFAEKVDFEKVLLQGIHLADRNLIKKNISETQHNLKTEGFFDSMENKTAIVKNINTRKVGSPVSEKTNSIRSLRFYLSRAALILVILTAAIFTYSEFSKSTLDKNQIYNIAFAEPPSSENVFRSKAVLGENPDLPPSKEESYQMWKKAKKAYNEKNYPKSLKILEQIELASLDDGEQAEVLFQKGLLNMLLQKHKVAFDIFQEVTYDPSRTEWYKALLMLQLDGPKEEVIQSFTKIVNSPTNRYKEDAINILKDLENIKE